MDELIFRLVELAIVIIAIVITRFMIPWLKSQLSAEEMAIARQIAEIAVMATQQVYGDLSGEERKNIAIHHLLRLCEAHKITLTEHQIDTLIEAAVKAKNIAEGK